MTNISYSDPPIPPLGYRWILNEQFSDEFNSNVLDSTKWNDTFGDWEGRPPALFVPEAISVKNGNLEIKSGILEQPYKNYTIYGGAVSSNSFDAHFGYYECRVKASKIAMSTTFWMSNQKVPFKPGDYETDSISQELDIQEAIGGGTTNEKFRKGMNSNTHFRYIRCGEEKEKFYSIGTGTTLPSEVSETYHTYGAWWKSANEVRFYANDILFDTVLPSTEISEKPFDRSMKINMVTETYNWQPPPSNEDLLDDSINTAYYDWVRSYMLVPINEAISIKAGIELYKESLSIIYVKGNSTNSTLSLEYAYKANTDKDIDITVKSDDKVVQSSSLNALSGFGRNINEISTSFSPEKGKSYVLEISFVGDSSKEIIEFQFSE